MKSEHGTAGRLEHDDEHEEARVCRLGAGGTEGGEEARRIAAAAGGRASASFPGVTRARPDADAATVRRLYSSCCLSGPMLADIRRRR